MKNLSKITTGLFLFLAMILFLFALSMIFSNSVELKFYPWDKEKFRYHLDLDDYQRVEEEIIPLALLLNREDNEIYSWIGGYFERRGNLLKAADYYQKTITFNPLDDYELYQKRLKIEEKLGRREEKEKILNFLGQKLEKAKYPTHFSADLAKNLYLLGEEYLKSGDYQKAIYWWTKAKEILPEWSYFHLETASLYQKLGEEDKLKEVLNNCLEYFFPKEHCQSYLDKKVIEVEEPGFWRDKILEIENI